MVVSRAGRSISTYTISSFHSAEPFSCAEGAAAESSPVRSDIGAGVYSPRAEFSMEVGRTRMIAASVRLDRHGHQTESMASVKQPCQRGGALLRDGEHDGKVMSDAWCLMASVCVREFCFGSCVIQSCKSAPSQGRVWSVSGHHQSKERSRSSFINRSSA